MCKDWMNRQYVQHLFLEMCKYYEDFNISMTNTTHIYHVNEVNISSSIRLTSVILFQDILRGKMEAWETCDYIPHKNCTHMHIQKMIAAAMGCFSSKVAMNVSS